MPLDPTDIPDLIRRFEPILFFHEQACFFPSDAKRYMENCAVWEVTGAKLDDKTNWGGSGPIGLPRKPRVDRGFLTAARSDPGTFIGDLDRPEVVALFLDPAGWRVNRTDDSEDFVAGESDLAIEDVTADSDNRYPALFKNMHAYGNDRNDGKDKALQNSRFWYHAEVFERSDLALLNRRQEDPGLPRTLDPRLDGIISRLPADSVLLCYYLFFPGSFGRLEGDCDLEDHVLHFDSHAGHWACVAVLLEDTSPEQPPEPRRTEYQPTFIGLTSRAPGIVSTEPDGLRFGMVVFEWKTMSKVPHVRGPSLLPGDHPLVFVGAQTQGLYRQPGEQAATPLDPGDYARLSCGKYETFEMYQPYEQERIDHDRENEEGVDTFVIKWLTSSFIFGFGVVGVAVGLLAALFEGIGLAEYAGLELPREPEASTEQFDHPPEAGHFGFVVHPTGVVPPGADEAKKVAWPILDGEAGLTTVIASRTYSLRTGTKAAPFSRPPWLPSRDRRSGFRGRWGNCVTDDPRTRRAGMHFPEFWKMFLLALAQAKSL